MTYLEWEETDSAVTDQLFLWHGAFRIFRKWVFMVHITETIHWYIKQDKIWMENIYKNEAYITSVM